MAVKANGQKIRRLRLREGLNGSQLAAAVGISRFYLSNIELGKRHGSPAVRLRIAQHLKVDLDDITYDDEPTDTRDAVGAAA